MKPATLRIRIRKLFRLTVLIIAPFACGVKHMPIENSDRIVFLGDSITELGVQPYGYVTLLRDSLTKKHPNITVIGAGVSGNRVPQLQERLDRDVLSKKPTIVIIYIGINDVWHFLLNGNGTPKDKYEAGLGDIIERIQKADARVILCTPTVIGEKHHGDNQLDAQLDEYSDISRRVANRFGVSLCDLRKAFINYLRTHNPGNNEKGILTVDGVHLNNDGNQLVADAMMKCLEQ